MIFERAPAPRTGMPSAEALDKDKAMQAGVRNAARILLEAVQARRSGHLVSAGDTLEQPRPK